MYFHPLQEEIGNLTEEALSGRVRELTRKLGTARRWMRNPDMISQIEHALSVYRIEQRNRRIKQWQDNWKKNRGEPEMGELINIE